MPLLPRRFFGLCHVEVTIEVYSIGAVQMPPQVQTQDGTDVYWTATELVLHPIEPRAASGVSGEAFRNALIQAAAAWNDAQECAPRIKIAPLEHTQRRALQDGGSIATMVSNQWCPPKFSDRTECYGAERAAVTRLFPHLQPGHAKHGSIVEVDLEINAVDYQWSEEEGLQRLQALLVHELGHILGLNHPCGETVSCTSVPQSRASAMYPNPLELGRALALSPNEEDIASLCGTQPGPSGLGSDAQWCSDCCRGSAPHQLGHAEAASTGCDTLSDTWCSGPG